MSLQNIRVVLVRTFHPGNIGSALRSMKTMGLEDLCLVSPRDFPNDQANKMAAGAEDLLGRVKVVESLTEAIASCTLVIASTVRRRSYDLPELSPAAAARKLVVAAASSPVALLFGPERMGLHNQDLQHATHRVTIPATPAYNSLNMAAAVQILSYEIFKAAFKGGLNESQPVVTATRELPSAEDIERLHIHLEKVLHDIDFLRPHQGETLQRLRTLITRAEPDLLETNIIRGILTAMEKARGKD